MYSRRINKNHRLVYEVCGDSVKIIRFCYPATGGNMCIFEGEDWTGIDRFWNGCPYSIDLPTPYFPSYAYCINDSYKVCYLATYKNICNSDSDKLDNICPSAYYALSTTNPRACYNIIDYYKNEQSKANAKKTQNRLRRSSKRH